MYDLAVCDLLTPRLCDQGPTRLRDARPRGSVIDGLHDCVVHRLRGSVIYARLRDTAYAVLRLRLT